MHAGMSEWMNKTTRTMEERGVWMFRGGTTSTSTTSHQSGQPPSAMPLASAMWGLATPRSGMSPGASPRSLCSFPDRARRCAPIPHRLAPGAQAEAVCVASAQSGGTVARPWNLDGHRCVTGLSSLWLGCFSGHASHNSCCTLAVWGTPLHL